MNMSMGVFIATHCQGEVGAGVAFTVNPSLTGDAIVGETLTVSLGTATGATALAGSLRYVSDDTEIDTFTADGTYLLDDADFGEQLYLHVTAEPGGVTAVSAPTGAVAVNAGLVAYWSLEEASGTRADSRGDNDLADNNTVTQAAGKVGNAAAFASANTEYLSIADNADLSTGDIAFTFFGWVYLTTLANGTMAAKWASFEHEWSLIYNHTDHAPNQRFTFSVSSNGALANERVDATDFGAPSTGTWYFIAAWHNPTANTINIQVNNGTVTSVAHSAGVRNGAGGFSLGRLRDTVYPLNGRVDEAGFCKTVLSATLRTWLYNGGSGRSFAEIDPLFLEATG